MKYEVKPTEYESIGPGTAGIAQRIQEGEEIIKSGLNALMHNEILACSQNQY